MARSFKEFREAGLLWALNRYALHPQGFAVSFTFDSETCEVLGWDLLGDGTEAWTFDEETDDSGFERFTKLINEAKEKESGS